jgi:hypothetical protein
MQRKRFITNAIATSFTVAAAGAALAATPVPQMTLAPGDTGVPCGRRRVGAAAYPYGSPNPDRSPNPNAVLAAVERRLFRLIGQLERDPNDYAGHKQQAIGYMQQALTQLHDALAAAGINLDSPIRSGIGKN